MKSLWDRFTTHLLQSPDALGFSIDISRMRFGDDYLERMQALAEKAIEEMKVLEAGSIANLDEKRMVGHYWLRAPQLAPTHELRDEIEKTNASIKEFAKWVHEGGKFTDVLVIGIGGSALGPQFVADALGTPEDRVRLHYFDNTDPDGFDRVLAKIGDRIAQTLTIVISKSGGTKETRNGMLEAERRYTEAGLVFGEHAVAVTGAGSELDKRAEKQGWLLRFPMWDWVGGRTSVMSTVGLVPLCLQGVDIDAFLGGAAAMDEWTREAGARKNPAMLLALMWHFAGNGRGEKDMVVLPYKDRLMLFSKYLQQLVMESLGKELDRNGATVHQGIAVYGNKGSTDQHAYVQQLRDGVHNFFVTFIEVRKDRSGPAVFVEPGFTSGDYLQGFLRGTRTALYEGGRDSITVSLPDVTPWSVGALIALYERAVGFYASLVNINAYDQPGVESGKKAATAVLRLQEGVVRSLTESGGSARTAVEIGANLGEDPEAVYHILRHLAANDRSLTCAREGSPAEASFTRL